MKKLKAKVMEMMENAKDDNNDHKAGYYEAILEHVVTELGYLTDKTDTRIEELEGCLEDFVEDDKGVQTVLLAGDNYDRCDRCSGVYHKEQLTGKKFMRGDDYEVRLYCEHCE